MVLISNIFDFFLGASPKKGKMAKDEPEIPKGISEEELKFYYRTADGSPFTPVYELQNEIYVRSVVRSVKIEGSYKAFRDTSWMERYTTNIYQFSAAKSVTTAREMARQVYDQDGTLRSWPKFRDAANAIQHTANEVHLRVERDNCSRQAILADKFTDMRADADIYPYWIYQGRMDSRERPEHLALEGLIFRIGDRWGDAMFPPSDWNCRCTGKPIDDLYLRDRRRVVQSNEQAKGWLHGSDKDTGKPFVDPQFRYNPADQGMMPRVGKYFYEMPNANKGNAKMFGLEGPAKKELHYSPMEDLNGHVKEWKRLFYTDSMGNIVFQNEELLSNVFFTRYSAHNIHQHPRGVGTLPETIMQPAEVWSKWEDPNEQRVVMRAYITWGGQRDAYVAITRDGAIQDAMMVSKVEAQKYRVGVPWIR